MQPFNPNRAVADYRALIRRRDAATTKAAKAKLTATAKRLRATWKKWQGEDSLHEMAFEEVV